MQVVLVQILVETHTMNKVAVAVELVKLATLMESHLEEMEEICLDNLELHMGRMDILVVEEQEVKELITPIPLMKVALEVVVTLDVDIKTVV